MRFASEPATTERIPVPELRLPELRRFIYPFKVPSDVAAKLNGSDLSTLDKEVIRMEYALQNIYSLCGKSVINTERVPLSLGEATPVDSRDSIYDLAELIGVGDGQRGQSAGCAPKPCLARLPRRIQPQILSKAARLWTASDFPCCQTELRKPLDGSVNPIFFTYFVDGPSAVVSDFLTSRNIRHLRCTGDSDDAELGKVPHPERLEPDCPDSSWSVALTDRRRFPTPL